MHKPPPNSGSDRNAPGYYVGRLDGDRLRRCYKVATPRIQQYLEAEILFVLDRLLPRWQVLELGCGYGRITARLAAGAGRVVGIDNAPGNIQAACRDPGMPRNCSYLVMDALRLGFPDGTFDCVVCAQNGISAFGADPEVLLREALRVTRPGGLVLLSTYAERFWPHRLRWFEDQAGAGLLGAIDHDRTRPGVIVCRDGFRSGTMSPEGFRSLCDALKVQGRLTEVDGSSLFCSVRAPGPVSNIRSPGRPARKP